MTLLNARLELAGDWGHMIPDAALAVVDRMRAASLDGVRLVSDRQPSVLRVEEHTSGPPAVWLHPGEPDTAWVIVDIGERDWSRLAYQFGHEMGHVLANSWSRDSKPAPPSQWVEEALVEAVSLHGLGRLADSWTRDPPFADDNGFGTAVATYRQKTVERHAMLAVQQGHTRDVATWFREHRQNLETQPGLNDYAKAASLTFLAEYERDPAIIEAVGALNRWQERTALPLESYLDAWDRSCRELSASPRLPERIRSLLWPS